jgi:two-component system sensor histidine kinase DegS
MTQADANLDKFIKKASDLLSANEANLRALVDQVDQYLKTASATETNGHQPPVANLQYLHQQANYLTNQNQLLKNFLDDKCEHVPATSHPLSRIQILQRQEEERARTAKDLEDSIGQLLANAIFELAAVKQLVTTGGNLDELIAGIDSLQEELEVGLTRLRFLIAELEPASTLGNFGLIAGLRRYLEKFSEQTDIEISYYPQTLIEQLPDTIELAIFRIIQEALHNIYQHAKATSVQVIISEENNCLKFSVIDNGIGLNPDPDNYHQRRLGLVGMKDLADMLNGTLHLKSEKNKGTQVILTVPYPQF